jgi:hypothetical protein|eukprot:COSAG01_NODE_7187_length_3313_cov_2.976976_1_plen_220_part_00
MIEQESEPELLSSSEDEPEREPELIDAHDDVWWRQGPAGAVVPGSTPAGSPLSSGGGTAARAVTDRAARMQWWREKARRDIEERVQRSSSQHCLRAARPVTARQQQEARTTKAAVDEYCDFVEDFSDLQVLVCRLQSLSATPTTLPAAMDGSAGRSVADIANEIEQRVCVPAAPSASAALAANGGARERPNSESEQLAMSHEQLLASLERVTDTATNSA